MAISPAAGGRRTVGCGGWGRRLAHSSILLRPSVDNAVRYDWRTFVTDTAGHGGKLIVLQRPDIVAVVRHSSLIRVHGHAPILALSVDTLIRHRLHSA